MAKDMLRQQSTMLKQEPDTTDTMANDMLRQQSTMLKQAHYF